MLFVVVCLLWLNGWCLLIDACWLMFVVRGVSLVADGSCLLVWGCQLFMNFVLRVVFCYGVLLLLVGVCYVLLSVRFVLFVACCFVGCGSLFMVCCFSVDVFCVLRVVVCCTGCCLLVVRCWLLCAVFVWWALVGRCLSRVACFVCCESFVVHWLLFVGLLCDLHCSLCVVG